MEIKSATAHIKIMAAMTSPWDIGMCSKRYDPEYCSDCQYQVECLRLIRNDLVAIRDYLKETKGKYQPTDEVVEGDTDVHWDDWKGVETT